MSTASMSAAGTDAQTTHGTTLVTGASSGIGYELAKRFAAAGDDLVLVARRAEKLEALATDLRETHGVESMVVPMDLTGATAVDDLLASVGEAGMHVDTLVNNAEFGVYGFYGETDAEVERSMLDLNVGALTELTKRVVPGMIDRGTGRILNVSSISAVYPRQAGSSTARRRRTCSRTPSRSPKSCGPTASPSRRSVPAPPTPSSSSTGG